MVRCIDDHKHSAGSSSAGQTINAAPPSSLPAAASSEAPSRSYKAMLKGPSAEPEEIPGAEAVVSAEDDAIELAKEVSTSINPARQHLWSVYL